VDGIVLDEVTPDEAGFRAWATARRNGLRRSAYLLCLDWHLADDLVQETLAKTYARWARITARGHPDRYVRRVLVTSYLDSRRRPWRRESAAAQLPDLTPDQAAADALDAVETAADRGRLVAALAALPPGQRAMVVLRHFEDLSVEQTAELLHCSTGNVKSQTARGLDRLRAALVQPRLTPGEAIRPTGRRTDG